MELYRGRTLDPIRFAFGVGVGFCLGFPAARAVTAAYPETIGFQPFVAAALLVFLWLWTEYDRRKLRTQQRKQQPSGGETAT